MNKSELLWSVPSRLSPKQGVIRGGEPGARRRGADISPFADTERKMLIKWLNGNVRLLLLLQ